MEISREIYWNVGHGGATLVSNCPFCLTLFEDGVIKGAGVEDMLRPKDIAEVLVERL
ncbi:hypothetical protein [Desulforhopalus singaporensis]|uniref:Cysteine-rich domain-containing protein n=1 Tax=Desulforhopalus singaporensis TaxID=91360 RepID=A0A1H0Q6P8_9BACT|nr:hypothetical protein [Desulforhopalus singaporensis]SDP12368.1 hypothetical protein SAMN05660330_01849 [Desulforhopalus singaporensis]